MRVRLLLHSFLLPKPLKANCRTRHDSVRALAFSGQTGCATLARCSIAPRPISKIVCPRAMGSQDQWLRFVDVVTDAFVNVDMAIETVLEHSKKSQLPGIAVTVRQMPTAVATAAELLQPTEPSLDKRTGQVSGIMNHAEAACRSSDTAKLFAPALSKEVLAIDAGDTYKGAKIPASLRRLLEGVRNGDTSVLDGYDSYKPNASHSKIGGKQNKKRKRANGAAMRHLVKNHRWQKYLAACPRGPASRPSSMIRGRWLKVKVAAHQLRHVRDPWLQHH